MKLREVYETETINASALRYHLYYLPAQIQREIKGQCPKTTFHTELQHVRAEQMNKMQNV